MGRIASQQLPAPVHPFFWSFHLHHTAQNYPISETSGYADACGCFEMSDSNAH
jgi:hypothetical protein